MEDLSKILVSKFLQYLASITGGFVVAFESSIPFFIPCFIVVILDVHSAYKLGKRVAKKYPERADGKFKSSHNVNFMKTMIVALVAIILANYVDVAVIGSGRAAQAFTVGGFIFYELWSVLENWSSESDKKWATLLQNVMVNKAERHFSVDLSELKNDKKSRNKHEDKQELQSE